MNAKNASRRCAVALGLAVVGSWMLHDAAHAMADGRSPLVFDSERFPADDHIADNHTAADSLKLGLTDIGNIRLVTSNAGTFGDRFNLQSNFSMEWPARSGIDHLVRGALWVGAVDVATGDTLVTIGGRDAFYLNTITEHSEFRPITPESPQEFSRLRTSPFYRPGTISDENLNTVYVDTLRVVKIGSEEPHRPMGIRVIQNTYGWGFDPVDDLVIVEFNIVNVSQRALQNVYIGVYSEFVTNNRLWYRPTNWPPGGAWFDYQDPEWDDERRLYLNHRVPLPPNTGATQWGGLKILGSGGRGATGRGPDSLSTMRISMEGWSWDTSQFLVWKDTDLYRFMSKGNTDWPIPEDGSKFPDPENTDINPCTVISVGPFSVLAPGDTAQVVFAFLAGEDRDDLGQNAFWAQKAYDDRYALPSPPSSPILKVYPSHRQLILRWSADPEFEPDPATQSVDFQGYRVYLSETALQTDFRLVHEYDIRDGVGFDTSLDAIRRDPPFVTEDGDTLHYELTLDNIPTGFKRYAAVTSYDFQVGDPPSLEGGVLQNSLYVIAGPDREQVRNKRVSVFPNPYRGESGFDVRNPDGTINPRKRVLWFVNLPARAQIKIYTLAGDVVREYEHDAATYGGTEAAGIRPDRQDLAVGRTLTSSGTMSGFDLLNSDGQEIASGLYLFSVRDKDTGERHQGKFMVIR